MLYKCLPEKELKSVMRWRWLLDYVAAVETLVLKRNWGDCCAIFKARRAFKRWRKDFDEDRRQIQASRVVRTVDGHRRFSVLWQYYVKGHRRYSQLPA
jgi:hypothetical protein